MKNFKILFLSIIGLLIVGSCSNDDITSEEPLNQPELQTIKIYGNITIPENVPTEKIGTLKVVSGFFENNVGNLAGKGTLGGDKTATCQIETFSNTIQLHTLTNNGNPFMYGLSFNNNPNDNIKIDAESTAISLIFMHRLFINNDAQNAPIIIQKIKNSQSFPDLVSEIKSKLTNGSLNFQTPIIDTGSLQNYKFVIVQTLSQLNNNYNIEQNGLQILNPQKVGNEIQFKIRNYKKRFATVYAHKYNNGQLTNTDIKIVGGVLGNGPFEWVGSGNFDWIKAWKDIFTLSPSEQIIEDSPLFAVDAQNAEKIFVKCYGLGNNIPTFGSESFNRGSGAVAMTAVFDYALPFVSLVTGLKDFPKKGELLRGRPADDPLQLLVKRWTTKFATDNLIHQDVAMAVNKKDLFERITEHTRSFITDPDNVKLYYNLIKQTNSLTGNQEIQLKSALDLARVVKAAEIAEAGVNLTEAIYATATSKWETEFIIDNNGNNVSIPTNGLVAYYPFNGNANDESGNGNNGLLSTALTEDRNGKVNSALYFNKNGFVQIKANDNLKIKGSITISLWVRPFYNNKNEIISFKTSAGGTYSGYEILSTSLGATEDFSINYGHWWTTGDDVTVIKQWVNIIYVYDENSQTDRAYRNGKLLGTSPKTVDSSNMKYPDYMYIGNGYNGYIDDIRIYNRALSESEILSLYNE